MQQLEDAVAEEASERIAEQVLGVDNLEMNQEGDEVSFTVQGDNGEMAFASGETSSEFFEGMGFRFALPAGLGRGMLQTVDENGEAMMISASYEVQDATAESFLRAMHQTVTDAGFTYFGAMFGAAEGSRTRLCWVCRDSSVCHLYPSRRLSDDPDLGRVGGVGAVDQGACGDDSDP
jgi:hypothetical protein